MGKLDTDYGSFSELIQQGKTYQVPRYQRKYSWRPKHEVAQLWQDIRQLYVAKTAGEAVDGHFIGPVVIGAAPPKALGSVLCPVIDGQQRLITLSLIIAALRDELVNDPDRADEITLTYLGKADDLRVMPGEHDRLPFEQIALKLPVMDKTSAVFKAYDFLRKQMAGQALAEDDESTEVVVASNEPAQPDDADEPVIEEVEEEAIEFKWDELLNIVGTELFLVSISGVPAENAYQIFASLNHKGLRLAQVDLIRNAVFMLLPEELGADAYAKVWVPLEQAMDEALLSRYLHTWVMRRGHNVPAKDTYRSFLEELSKPGMKPKAVRGILDHLFQDAWAYLLITKPLDSAVRKPFLTKTAPDSITKALARLQIWGSVPMEPVLMEIVGRWMDERLATSTAADLLRTLESFVVRRFIAAVPPNDLRSSFGRLVRQVHTVEDELFANALRTALCEDTRRWPTDAQLTEALKAEPLYRPVALTQTFFVLKRLAEELQGKECPVIKHGTRAEDYSIEHILPQGTGSGLPEAWQSDLAAWGDPDPIETWTTRVHVVGNLTLTAYNSELSNKPFAEKKVFIKDNLYLELSRQILEYDQWGQAEIDARSESLAANAIAIWPRPK